MKDNFLNKFKESFNELYSKQNNINDLLKSASELIQTGMKGLNYNYAAFHYRSSLLKEGRDSPFSFDKKELLSNVLCHKPKTWKFSDNEWIHDFLSSLLNTYLYIFGRDTSFSENCILWAEQQQNFHKRYSPKKGETDTLSPKNINIQSVSLTINLDANRATSSFSPSSHIQLIIPSNYYAYLTINGQIPSLLWEEVRNAIEEKAKKEENSKNATLCQIGEFRKIYYYLEHPENNKRPFSLLKKRGIEVATYFFLMERESSLISNAAKEFFKFVDPNKVGKDLPKWPYSEEDIQFFFRVIQAACVFTCLLGETMTVFPFQCYRPLDPVSEKDFRVLAWTTIQNMSSWEDKSPLQDDSEKRDFCSALTVYSQTENLKPHVERIRQILFSFMILSYFASTSGADISSNPDNFNNWDNLLSYFIKDDQIKDVKEQLRVTLHPNKIHWPIIALASADCLRGVKHEGKALSINMAIGSDVEFREVLTPIYSIDIVNSEGIPKFGQDPKFFECFQNKLRSFVRRNFSLVEDQYRFICIKIGYDGTIILRYISDLREDYHESTFSEIIKRIVPKTGLTIARVDAFGKATIFSRAVDNSHKLIFRSSAHGYWQTLLGNKHDEYQKSLSELIEEIKKLRNKSKSENQNWERFVRYILAPTIEQVSENPFAGGIIILVHDENQFKERHFRMPEGAAKIELSPANNIEFIDLDTFRRLIIQDGATVINIDTGNMSSRIQLATKGFNDLDKFTGKFYSAYIKRKACEWGTRHLSVLHFIASSIKNTNKEHELKKKVYCFIISQDGDVHVMVNRKEELCKSVLMG